MTDDERQHIRQYVTRAKFFIDNINQRRQTMARITDVIVECQHDFLERGIQSLRPLTRAEVGERIGMHESTVSRVTSNKYVATPRGIFELKYFFTTAIAGTSGETHSAEAVRHRIRAMVATETANDVLSDDAIVAVLRREGVDIARRTVAKYREALRIPNSVQRRREKAVPA